MIRPASNPTTDGPLVIAHRGASGYLPEHTLEAKAYAHALGVDYLEQDVVLTRDGVPVVLHDTWLEQVTDVADLFPGRQRQDGRHYAIDFSLEELGRLSACERRDRAGRQRWPARFDAPGNCVNGFFSQPDCITRCCFPGLVRQHRNEAACGFGCDVHPLDINVDRDQRFPGTRGVDAPFANPAFDNPTETDRRLCAVERTIIIIPQEVLNLHCQFRVRRQMRLFNTASGRVKL